MAHQLLLIGNPSKRKAKVAPSAASKKKASKPAVKKTAAKVARKKPVKKLATKVVKVAKNPAARMPRSTPRGHTMAKPKHKRRSRRSTAHLKQFQFKAAKNPAPRRKRRSARKAVVVHARRNPSLRQLRTPKGILHTLKPALVATGGALALDIAIGFGGKYLPAQLKTGPLAIITKLVGAIAIGMAAEKATDKRTGEEVMLGGLNIVMYDAGRALLQKAIPSLPLSGLEASSLGAYDLDMVNSAAGLGYLSPQPIDNSGSLLGLGAYDFAM